MDHSVTLNFRLTRVRRNFSIAFFLLFLSILYSCSRESSYTAKIRDLILPYVDDGTFTGTVLVADKNGIIYQDAFGYADKENNRLLTVETPFYLASVSKQLTSSAALILVGEGTLNLDDPITKYLDGLPSLCSQITMRNLLNHTSGFPDYYNVVEVSPGFTNTEVVNYVKSMDSLAFEPNTQYAYSNTGYVLASSIIQKITCESFSSFMDKTIFKPVGMQNTYVLDEHTVNREDRAIGYSGTGEIVDYIYRTTGAGGIYSTVYDLFLWDRALYSGKPVPINLLKSQAFKPSQLKNGEVLTYGLGWNVDPEKPGIVYHTGGLVGFATLFYRDTTKRQVIILLSNNGSQKLKEIQEKISALLNNRE